MKLILIQILLLVCSCQSQRTEAPKKDNSETAIKFMNDYIAFCDLRTTDKDVLKWIDSNPLLTNNFKKAHRNLIEKAYKDEPEVGLDFDPIFDAQDYPGSFVVKNIEEDGYIILKGKDWEDFIVTVKIVYEGSQWLIDGAGIINIPQEKQARR
jgi:hypothetical protein